MSSHFDVRPALTTIDSSVRTALTRYARTPEHTYECFLHSAESYNNPFFFSKDDEAILAYYTSSDKEWTVFSEPLCAPARAGVLLSELLLDLFHGTDTVKVVLDVETETRRGLLAALSPKLRARRTSEKFIWPILDLHTYDEHLSAPRMKSLRNVRNRFLREHTSDVVSAASVPPEQLHVVVAEWKKNRPAKHRAYSGEYHALIDEQFSGTTDSFALIVDGKPEVLSAGWAVPNSKGFYHAVALHTYRYWGLGEMLMLESLRRMKAKGYEFANLGGSDENLFAFKKKFGEVRTYTTEYFSIVRA